MLGCAAARGDHQWRDPVGLFQIIAHRAALDECAKVGIIGAVESDVWIGAAFEQGLQELEVAARDSIGEVRLGVLRGCGWCGVLRNEKFRKLVVAAFEGGIQGVAGRATPLRELRRLGEDGIDDRLVMGFQRMGDEILTSQQSGGKGRCAWSRRSTSASWRAPIA